MRRSELDGVEKLVAVAEASVDEIERHVQVRCRRLLQGRPDIDPRDACHEVLVTLLGRRFLSRFDPQKGSFRHFMEGVIRFKCYELARRTARKARIESIDEPSCRSRASDPVAGAMDREFREALAASVEHLTPAERSVFADVVERAEGGRCCGPPGNSTRYARESRCRLRLRWLLMDFADE